MDVSAPTLRPDDDTPTLELRGVNKSFGAIQVLHDVHLTAYRGKVTALVGDNGAGKSTLIKAIAGIHPVDSGEFLFEGKPVTVSGPRDAAALGIEVVYQDLALADNLDVVQNMFLGRERHSGVLLDEVSMEQAARETLARLSVRTLKSVRQRVSSLSGGQRQTVAVARAAAFGRKVVIMDEPTAALGVRESQGVLDLIKRITGTGIPVVLISHDIPAVFEVADRIHIHRLGRRATVVRPQDHTMNEVVGIMTGALPAPPIKEEVAS